MNGDATRFPRRVGVTRLGRWGAFRGRAPRVGYGVRLVAWQLDAAALFHPLRDATRHGNLAGEPARCAAVDRVFEHVILLVRHRTKQRVGLGWHVVHVATCLGILPLGVTEVGMAGRAFELAAARSFN